MTYAWEKVVDLVTGSDVGQSAAYGVHDGKLYFSMDAFPGHTWNVWDPASPSSFTVLSWTGTAEDAGGGCWGNDGYFYFAGGEASSSDLDELWRYDPSGDTWTQMASMPQTMLYSNLAPWEQYVYAFGSNDGADPYQRVFKYDTVGDSWTDLGVKFSEMRGDGITCVPIPGDGIYLLNGFAGSTSSSTDRNNFYDPGSETVSDIASGGFGYTDPGRGNGSGVFADGTIPMYHTNTNPFDHTDGTYLYDPATDTWTEIIGDDVAADFEADSSDFLMPAGIIDNTWYVLGFASIWKLTTDEVFDRAGWGILL